MDKSDSVLCYYESLDLQPVKSSLAKCLRSAEYIFTLYKYMHLAML